MHIAILLAARAGQHQVRAAGALTAAATAQGHRVTVLANSAEVTEAAPDFVLTFDADLPKTAPFPTYLVLHGHRDHWLADRDRLANLLTFDGYLALTPLLRRFAHDLLHATHRDGEPGTFGLVPGAAAAPGETSPAGPAIVGDPGPMGASLLRRLEGAGWQRSQPGPEEPRGAGIAVVLQPPEEAAEGLPAPALLEAAAAGAVVVAPQSPWLASQFGDSVLAYDALAAPRVAFDQVAAHAAWARANPDEARARAAAAREVVAKTLSAEALVPGLTAWHEARLAYAAALPPIPETVSVVVRAGGRPAEVLQRALRSIAAQRDVRVEVVLVLYARPELAEAAAAALPRGFPLRVVQAPGANRSAALWAGFGAASGEWLAALDDDDEWFPDHLESVVRSALRAGTPWAFGGLLRHMSKAGPGGEHRRLQLFPLGPLPANPLDRPAPIAGTALVFRRDMLARGRLTDPGVETADDSHLLLGLLQQATPPFSWRATAVHYEGPHNALFRTKQGWDEAVLGLRLRAAGRLFPPVGETASLDLLRARTDLRVPGAGETAGEGGSAVHQAPPAFRARLGPEERWDRRPLVLPGVRWPDATFRVAPPDQPWAYGYQFTPPLHGEGPHLVRLRLRVMAGVAGFGVLAGDERDFLYRVFVPPGPDPVVVELPVPRPGAIGPLVIQASGEPGAVDVLLLGGEVVAAGA